MTAPHDEHLDRKINIINQFKRSKVMESFTMLSDTIGSAVQKWQKEKQVAPFSAAQSIATRYFTQFAFGASPSEQEERALAQASLVSSEAKVIVATDPHYIPCLKPLAKEEKRVSPFSADGKKIMSLKGEWIKTIVKQRIERDFNRPLADESKDLLDAVVRQAIISQGGKEDGTLKTQFGALGEDRIQRVVQQVARDVSSLVTAATETTPTMIAYAMYILAHDQERQEALRHEIKNAGSEVRMGGIFNAHALLNKMKMPVLRDILDNSLTQHPPAQFAFPRQMNEDIEIDGVSFKEGDVVFFHLSELGQVFHTGQYACPGKTVAEMEASMALAMIVDSCKIEPFKGMSIPSAKPNSTVSTPVEDVPLAVYSL